MPGGGQPGNNNATKNKPWRDAIDSALNDYEKEGKVARNMALREIAMKMIEQALEGDKDARKEIGDRLEGKPRQAVELSGHLTASEMSTDQIVEALKDLQSQED